MLKEVEGERQLPIWTGSYEAEMIISKLEHKQQKYPQSYDLF
jgi:bifunctional DNase/RNase